VPALRADTGTPAHQRSALSAAPGFPKVNSCTGTAKPLFESHPFNVISVKHLERLLGGELLAQGPRLDWALLLRRTHGFDPLECPHCGARLRVVAEITERETIDRILKAVGYERRVGPKARAPTQRVAAPPNNFLGFCNLDCRTDRGNRITFRHSARA